MALKHYSETVGVVALPLAHDGIGALAHDGFAAITAFGHDINVGSLDSKK